MSSPSTLAVISQSGESLSFFNNNTGELTGRLENLPAEPHDLAYDSPRNLLYVSHTYSHGHYFAHGSICNTISIIDATTKKVTDTIDLSPFGGPHGLSISPDNSILYATVETGFPTGGLVGIDLASRAVVKSIPCDGRAHWFTLTPDGKKAYTSNMTSPFVSVLDLEREQLAKKIPVTGSNQGAVSRDGRFAYFPTPSAQMKLEVPPTIEVVDTSTDEIVKTVPFDEGILAVHVTARRKILVAVYRLEEGASAAALKPRPGRLVVLDATSLERVGEVEVGKFPLALKSSPDGLTGYVANVFGGTVTVVDLAEMAVRRTIEVDTTPRADKAFHQGAHGMALI
ncbi:putative surface layer protein [Mytilinidion resinicola]|uniref:Surface layer protein n=1 Tax=Mytilinidion resinicola TaxID=574789 RepID=A0A6A6Y8L0_9PEZI|nr:putative surface layer protein [Mytilinidion resinicola]KAF2805171.1 putative surface layer protein [Mytilinidion resinicola]